MSISEVCLIVKRPFVYASHGGELKIHVDGCEIATYPDQHFSEERYCPAQIQEGALITFDAVTNDQVNSSLALKMHLSSCIKIQMEMTVEIKSNGETKTFYTWGWRDPLYLKKPGTCKRPV